MIIKNGILFSVLDDDILNGTFTFPEGVKSIGYDAFGRCKTLTHIDIPKGVKSIGEFAFTYCYSLVSVKLPEGLESIEDFAFADCESLASINLPDGVKLGKAVFQGCESLSKCPECAEETAVGD